MRIDQVFPRCARCGRMIFTTVPRIEIRTGGNQPPITLCSELCRDEYVELRELSDLGAWRTPAADRGVAR